MVTDLCAGGLEVATDILSGVPHVRIAETAQNDVK